MASYNQRSPGKRTVNTHFATVFCLVMLGAVDYNQVLKKGLYLGTEVYIVAPALVGPVRASWGWREI